MSPGRTMLGLAGSLPGVALAQGAAQNRGTTLLGLVQFGLAAWLYQSGADQVTTEQLALVAVVCGLANICSADGSKLLAVVREFASVQQLKQTVDERVTGPTNNA